MHITFEEEFIRLLFYQHFLLFSRNVSHRSANRVPTNPGFLCRDTHPPLAGKVRGVQLPSEYELARFVQTFANRHPTWDASVSTGSWKGVVCDKNENVQDIYWYGYKLNGNVSWEYIPNSVKHLSLANNELHGSVDIAALPRNMKGLQLQENEFSGVLELEALPPTITDANFSLNKFSGTVDLCHLPHSMKELRLNDNIDLSGFVYIRDLPDSLRTFGWQRTNILV